MSALLNQKQTESNSMHPSSAEHATGQEDSEQTFTLYPKLPPEIKSRVWKFATQDVEPRLVALGRKGGKIPAVLHACHLSRSIAAPTYTFLKYREHHMEGFSMPIDFEIDTVYLRAESSYRDLRSYFPNSLTKVKRLAVSSQSDRSLHLDIPRRRFGEKLTGFQRIFPKIQEFFCISSAKGGQAAEIKDLMESTSNYNFVPRSFFNHMKNEVYLVHSHIKPPPLKVKLMQFREG